MVLTTKNHHSFSALLPYQAHMKTSNACYSFSFTSNLSRLRSNLYSQQTSNLQNSSHNFLSRPEELLYMIADNLNLKTMINLRLTFHSELTLRTRKSYIKALTNWGCFDTIRFEAADLSRQASVLEEVADFVPLQRLTPDAAVRWPHKSCYSLHSVCSATSYPQNSLAITEGRKLFNAILAKLPAL
jgi:hypothetical protein